MHGFEVHSNESACRKKVRLGLEQVQYHMSDAEVKTMEKILIEMVFDMAILFNITERPSFRRFVESIRVNASSKLLVAPRLRKVCL